MKKVISLLLCVVLLVGMVPVVTRAETGTATIETDANEVSVSGSNGIGTLISEDIQSYQEEAEDRQAQYSEGYAVVDLEIDGNIATVEYSSFEEANLIVSVYSEDGMQLFASGYTSVTAEDTVAEVTIEGDMPQYFLVSAYLVDIYDFSPLCPSYDTPEYTQEMQELLASTVEDYDAEKVVKLEESNETNFAVYADTTIIVKEQETINTFVSADDDALIYVISNVDEQISALAEGAVVAYYHSEDIITIFKVGNIAIEENTATITGTELEINEVFSHIKIGVDGDTADATVDASTASEGVTYLGEFTSEEPSVQDKKWQDSIDKTYTIVRYDLNEKDGNVSVTGSFDVSLNFHFAYNVTWTYQWVECKVSPKAEFDISISGSFNKDIVIGEVGYDPIPGVLFLGFRPTLKFSFSGKVHYNAVLTTTIGFCFDSSQKNKFTSLNTAPKLTDSYEIQCSVYVGIDFAPTLELKIPKTIFKISAVVTAELGVQIDAQLAGSIIGANAPEGEIYHTCKNCFKLELYGKIKFNVAIDLWGLKPKSDFKPISKKIAEGYYSVDNVDFGKGSCPHLSYRTTIQVKDENGKTVSGATVTSQSSSLGTTNRNGVLVIYLEAGTYTLNATANEKNITKKFAVTDAGSVTLKFTKTISGTGSQSSGILGAVSSSIYKDETVLKTGQCGDNLTWSLTKAGTLYINGTGEMDDFFYDTFDFLPWGQDIKSVFISDGVTSIGENAFYNCQSLTTIEIPNSITKICVTAFYNCKSLNYNIYDNAKYLGNDTNPYCALIEPTSSSITSCQIHPKTVMINNGAFSGCAGLISVAIPNSVTSIGEDAFYNCANLTSVSIPGNVTNIESHTFSGCTSLISVHIQKKVTSIGNYAFFGCTSLTSITIPDSVTSIGDYAFGKCNSLTSFAIPDSVTIIGNNVFNNCSNLKYNNYDNAIYLGNNSNPYYAIIKSNSSSITNCMIHSNTVVIAGGAFFNCDSLSSITIPDGIISIGEDAFMSCDGLSAITIPDNVTSIGKDAFYSCSSLTSVAIGDSVTSIGDYAFRYCKSLTSVTIPDSVISIGYRAYEHCSSLTSVAIGDGVRSIGDYAFSNCSSVTSVTIGDSVIGIGDGAFSYCGNLAAITIPKSVTSIGSHAFYNCSSLITVTLGDSITSIGVSAFSCCGNLTAITIPESVTDIQGGAFWECSSLSSVYFKGNAPNMGDTVVFHNVIATVYYPADNATWTSSVMKDYSGTLTWVMYYPGDEPTVLLELRQITSSKRPTKGLFNGSYGTEETDSYTLKTASFENLVPEQEYLLLALVNMEAEQPLSADNLLFVDQAAAQEDGTLVFQYVQRTAMDISYVIACGASNKDLNDAVITFPFMCCDEEVQAVNPIVVYDGKTLQEGLDYTVVGTTDFVEDGTYTCYIRGIYNYTGLVECSYTVENAMLTETEGYLYLKLDGDCNIMPEINRDLYVDLNGYTLTGTINTNGYKIYGMDSTTDEYTCENMGYFNCVDENGNTIVPETHFKSDITGSTKRYMTINTDNGYSFHCFYLGVTHTSLKPTVTGLGYKAVFYGDAMVIAQLDADNAYGFSLRLDGNNAVARYKSRDSFVSGKTVTLRLNNFDVESYGETSLYAAVMLKLSDGTVITSEETSVTMRSVLESVSANYSDYTAEQLAAVKAMIEKYSIVKSWDTENLYL